MNWSLLLVRMLGHSMIVFDNRAAVSDVTQQRSRGSAPSIRSLYNCSFCRRMSCPGHECWAALGFPVTAGVKIQNKPASERCLWCTGMLCVTLRPSFNSTSEALTQYGSDSAALPSPQLYSHVHPSGMLGTLTMAGASVQRTTYSVLF